ncbi:MAG: peptide chain release factor-like protein [Phycisphaerales bacterium]|nr:peptide chain release factor-like protein [Phycisphaerales bacterium]
MADFMRECALTTGRVSGPGGQHRNRVETGVFLTHRPTSLEAQATERRSQVENRRVAIDRLRLKLAVHARSVTGRSTHDPSDLWKSRRSGRMIRVSANHWDYPAILAEALDVIVAHHFDVASAASVLGVSATQLAKLLAREKEAWGYLARGRKAAGLRPLSL